MTEPPPRRGFLYLRHGRTEWNRRGIAQGAADIPLDETGIAQAERAAEILAAAAPAPGIDRIVASPLARAFRTAEIVRAGLGGHLPLSCEDGLREAAFGPYEGRALGPWLDHWIAGLAVEPGIEPFAAFSARITASVMAHLRAPGTVLFVGHGAAFRALRAGLGLGAGPRLPNAEPLAVEPEGAGWRIATPGPPAG